MKTYKNLYPHLCSCGNLALAFKKAKKRKSTRSYVIEFERNLNENLQRLREELLNETYSPAPLKQFILRDPKTRKISVSLFRDRIVHHALGNILLPIYERVFICDSYANRLGKGTSAALRRFIFFKRKATCNGKKIPFAKNNNQVCGYALKADVRHYFETVDHALLIKIISQKVKDEKVIRLTKKILANYDSKESGKGMPLGNWTSQFFANIYLNELDYFVKHQLKAKYYLRYVDDFVILHLDKKVLEEHKKMITPFLEEKLNLELHPEKSKIMPLAKAIPLLGYKEFYYYRLLRKRNFRKVKDTAMSLKGEYAKGRITEAEFKEVISGWFGYLKEADTYGLGKTLLADFKNHGTEIIFSEKLNATSC